MNIEERVYEHTRYFVQECGQRIAGTAPLLKASDYIIDFYKKEGIKTETYEFEVPVCKVLKSEVKAKIGDQWLDLAHTPVMFARSTPKEGIALPLVYVENGSIANFEEKDVKGKIVLISRDVYQIYPDLSMYKRLYEYGAAAVLYTTNDGHWDVPYVYANFETMDEPDTIPTAVIHYNTALDLVQKHATEVYMNIQYEVEMGKTRTTIGVVEGTELADENVICCAHLDSAVSSTGATDDVAGVAMVMELAKYYNQKKLAGEHVKRTMRFIAWSGHECGLHGSKYYLFAHPDIFKSTKFVLNYDIVGNVISNYSVLGGFLPKVQGEIQDILQDLKLDWPVQTAPMVCDTLNFAVREIPQFTLSAGVFCGNHTKYDSLDLIAPEGFKYPLKFSKAVLEWAGNNELEQGYPEELNEGMRMTGEMYGWGLFGIYKEEN